jgi:hypothetical protein
MKIIHIDWDGPYSLEGELNKINNNEIDYGIYQIYGTHPIYGSDKLIYIGKADFQTFGVRIRQERWLWNSDPKTVKIYIGRLAGTPEISLEDWSAEINKAERLLIYSHAPAYNSSNILTLGHEEGLLDVHILNWGRYRDLLPEVSGARWTYKHDEDVYELYKYKMTDY